MESPIQTEKPIFIIGTGGCGSTIFHDIFVHHPQVAWLSGFCDRYPKKPELNRWLMKAIDIPILGDYIMKKVKPSECYIFWEHYCKGFSHPFRDLVEEDVTYNSKSNIQKTMKKMLTQKRNRLLIKITGWPRIKFLKEIFPDAKFIHVIRDGRAMSNSMINVEFWRGWEGPQNWRWGMLNEEYQNEWEKYDESFVILAAIEWKILIDAVEKAKRGIQQSQFFEIKYEKLMSEPIKVFKEVIDFCELDWTTCFESKIEKFELKNMNYKWKENLPETQKKMLNEFLNDYLKRYGYE